MVEKPSDPKGRNYMYDTNVFAAAAAILLAFSTPNREFGGSRYSAPFGMGFPSDSLKCPRERPGDTNHLYY